MDVIRMKEQDIARVRREIEALRTVAPLLDENGEMMATASEPEFEHYEAKAAPEMEARFEPRVEARAEPKIEPKPDRRLDSWTRIEKN
jgi:hypothetical protein